MTPHNGFIIYRGPSLLTGAPIAAVAIVRSQNEKTGAAAQTHILPDSGERPTEALRSGGDEAVCGDCKHRPLKGGTCYVVVRQGPTKVWDALQRGLYPDFTAYPDIVGEVLRGRVIRLGSYGDPAAVPIKVWRDLTACAAGWAGYTHQWRRPDAQPLRDLCMASVDSVAEMAAARLMGWRTFRVRLSHEELQRGEGVCPASAEAGHKLTCSECRACNGLATERRGGIAIQIHGNHPGRRAARFAALQREVA